ncbi:hypothetical protein AK88_03667 [Plasmodium fragile]|uniref:Uncharacterized protein n=1 Tax=Plasmodium fragile TaxID=5857 RepID=A0A0D9QHX5_PLAFR|nr:uncharacterized protein AK88_03667 [Plasmodium fragile]KJP86660.1 hypothetical protein AK88_03667 [Plasmodium fragile]
MVLRNNRGEGCDPRKRKAQGGAVRMELANRSCHNGYVTHDYATDDCAKEDSMKDVTGEGRARAITATTCGFPCLCHGEGSSEEGPRLLLTLPESSARTETRRHPSPHAITPVLPPSPQLRAEYQVKELTKLMDKYDVRKNFACFGGPFTRFANETYTFTHRYFKPHLGIHMNTYLFNDFIFIKNYIKIIKFSRWHILVYLSDNKIYVYKHSRSLWHLDHFNEWKHLPIPTCNEIKDIQIVSCDYKGDLYFDFPKGTNYALQDDYQFCGSTHQHETIDPIHFFGISLVDSRDNLYLGLNTNVNASRINIKQMKMIIPRSFEKRKLRMRTILVSLPELNEYDLRSCAVYLKYASIFELSYTRRGNHTGGRRVSCRKQGINNARESSKGHQSDEAAATLHVENTKYEMDTNEGFNVDYRKGLKRKGRTAHRGRVASQMVKVSTKGKNKTGGSTSKPAFRGDKLGGSTHTQEETRAADSLNCAVGEMQRGEDHHDHMTRERAKKKRRINHAQTGGHPGQVPHSSSLSNGGRRATKCATARGGTINPSNMDDPPNVNDAPSAGTSYRATQKKDHFIFIKTSNNMKFKKRLIRSKPKVLLSGTSCAHGCVLFENKEIYFWVCGQGGSLVEDSVNAEKVVVSSKFSTHKGRQNKRFTFKKLEYPKLNIVDVVYCNNTYIMLSEDNILFILKSPYLHTLRAVNFFFYLNNYLPKGVNPKRTSGVLTLQKIRDSTLVKMYLTDYILVTVHSSKDICFTPILFHSVYSYMDAQYIDVLSTKYEPQVTKLIKDLGKFCTRGLENQFSHEEKSMYPNLIKYKMIRTCAQNKNCFTIYVSPNSLIVCIYNLFEYYQVLDTSISNFLSKYYIM